MINAEEAYKMTNDLTQKRIKRKYYRNMNYNVKMELVRCDIYFRQYELFISWQNPRNAESTKEKSNE